MLWCFKDGPKAGETADIDLANGVEVAAQLPNGKWASLKYGIEGTFTLPGGQVIALASLTHQSKRHWGMIRKGTK